MDKLPSPTKRALLSLTGVAALVLPGIISRGASASTHSSGDIKQYPAATDHDFIARAFEKRDEAVNIGDQAYGAIVVLNGKIVGQSPSHVVVQGDPTAHAEMEAIRDAAKRLRRRDLSGCTLYSSSHACPMCEAAAYWANIHRMVYGEAVIDAGRPSLCG